MIETILNQPLEADKGNIVKQNLFLIMNQSWFETTLYFKNRKSIKKIL